MASEKEEKIAIILIRGLVNIRYDIKDTLKLLGLHRKFACVVRPKSAEVAGMIKKAKDYITWGNIDEETYNELLEKRGEKDSQGNTKRFFRLNPPKGGFERKGTKKNFSEKGALGDRKEKINELLKRMI